MKKMSFLLLGLPLLLGSCAAAVSNGSADDVRVGMTEAQVRHLLGAPLARTVTPDSARWHYQWGTACPNGHARLGPLALSVGRRLAQPSASFGTLVPRRPRGEFPAE